MRSCARRRPGGNRESLYKTLKGGSKTRYETIQKLMLSLGVELTVQPIAAVASKKTARAKRAAAGKPCHVV